MRNTNEIIIVNESVEVEKTVVTEDFSHYTINKKMRVIDVVVERFCDDGSLVQSETYQFEEDQYMDNANESYLWVLIDAERQSNSTV